MIVIKDEQVGLDNENRFNSILKGLSNRQGSSIEYYEIRSDSNCEYNPVDNNFYHYVDYHGYRSHSLGGLIPLNSNEIEDLYYRVRLGIVEIYIVQSVSGNQERIYYTDINYTIRK
jgi:hypothetical protein